MRSASLRWLSVSASTRSRKPSTCVKSSRPPSNARRVKSPGSAGLQYGRAERADRIEEMIARPEWTCSSRTSSVVNDLGPGKSCSVTVHQSLCQFNTSLVDLQDKGCLPLKKTASPSSSNSPLSGCSIPHLCILQGSGMSVSRSLPLSLPFPCALPLSRTILRQTSNASCPDIRTTATPALPIGVESAKIVLRCASERGRASACC